MSEHLVVFPSRDGFPLEGVLHVPAGAGPHPAVVVCHPHPLMGGTMHNRVIVAIVRALTARGMAALRFNFRSRYGQGIAEQGDVAGAFDFLTTQPSIAGDCLALAGYSFGAGVAARHAPDEARALALVAPPSGDLSPDLLAGYERPVCIVVGDRDPVSPAADVRAFVAGLVAPTTLHVLPGVDHFFGPGLNRMASLVTDFLTSQVGGELSSDGF